MLIKNVTTNDVTTNENGFVLITSMMVLLILTLIGISAISTSIIEVQISGNELVYKEAFYQADGGTEAGIEMVEQNFACPVGFKSAPNNLDNSSPVDFFSIGGIDIFDKKFAMDEKAKDVAGATASSTIQDPDFPSDTIRSIRLPEDPASPSDLGRHTNLATFSTTQYATGSAIQMAAGYEGKGHGAAGSGALRAVEIVAAHLGRKNATSKILLQWKHLIGQEGDCIY